MTDMGNLNFAGVALAVLGALLAVSAIMWPEVAGKSNEIVIIAGAVIVSVGIGIAIRPLVKGRDK